MDISPKALSTQDTIHRPHEAQEEGKAKCVGFDFYGKGNKIISGVNIKYRGESEEKVIQGLAHLGIHHTCGHQTSALVWMPRNASRKELNMTVP